VHNKKEERIQERANERTK